MRVKTFVTSFTKMNTEPLDPTKTDLSELIIDPEAITQWVDGKLPTPHKMAVELLAEKFSSLNTYERDVQEIRTLMQESFSPRITAPAHTACKVLMAINGQTAEESMLCHESKDSRKDTGITNKAKISTSEATQDAILPASVKSHSPRSLDSLPFEIQFPQKTRKRNRYILPVAAVFLLSLLVGAIVFSENYPGHVNKHKHQNVAETGKGKKHLRDRKAATMTAPSLSPHADPEADNVQLANDDKVSSPHDENDQTIEKKKEAGKEKKDTVKDSSVVSPGNK